MQTLFRSVDIASLVFFRIVFGILCFIDIIGIWSYYHLWRNDFSTTHFQFTYYGFEWVTPFPEPFMSIFLWSLALAGLAIAVGWRFRQATIYFFFGFCYLFLLDKTHYLNHGYLMCWLSFVIMWLPANAAFSYDVWQKRIPARATIPYINIFVLVFLMSTVYFFGGIAKLNPDWLSKAQPMQIWLKSKAKMPFLGTIWAQKETAYIMSWCGMFLDLTVVFFLLFRRTRWWAFGAVVLFHITNTIIFQIGVFPWLSLALTLLFFSSDLPRKWVHFLAKHIDKIQEWQQIWSAKTTPLTIIEDNSSKHIYPKKIAVIGLMALITFHLCMPLRHHFFKGNVAWNEEGHRYAWRMMLRQKSGHGYFTLKNSDTGEEVRIRPRKYLLENRGQDTLHWFYPMKKHLMATWNFKDKRGKNPDRKMYTHPDMILQFAHHLRDEWQAKGWQNVEVYATIRCKLNHRKYQDYIDKEVDLAKIEWSFLQHSEWILPLQ